MGGVDVQNVDALASDRDPAKLNHIGIVALERDLYRIGARLVTTNFEIERVDGAVEFLRAGHRDKLLAAQLLKNDFRNLHVIHGLTHPVEVRIRTLKLFRGVHVLVKLKADDLADRRHVGRRVVDQECLFEIRRRETQLDAVVASDERDFLGFIDGEEKALVQVFRVDRADGPVGFNDLKLYPTVLVLINDVHTSHLPFRIHRRA